MLRIRPILLLAVNIGLLCGQVTQLDLRYQSKNVDFSGANATKPFKSGAILPSLCAVGEMFFKTDAPSGANLYGCTALNAWTLEQNSLPANTGNSGKVLTTDGTSLLFNSLGGDVSGPAAAVTVTQIQGRPVSSGAPTSGQALAWNAVASRWEPQTISGGGGAGASMASQLGDFVVTRASATTLNIGAGCAAATPCNIRLGSLLYSFVGGGSVSISAGTGMAYIYISSGGMLTVGHNLTAVCSGCTQTPGVASFPTDSIPLWTWTASSGAWDAAGGSDQRGFESNTTPVAGTGISIAFSGGAPVLSLDPTYLPPQLARWSCNGRLGDGLNAIAAGTYLQTTCSNETGVPITLTRVACFTDNNGTSRLNASNGSGTGLLTGAVTCTNSKNPLGANGTQSAATTLAAGDSISFSFVADGSSKQTTWVIAGTR